MSEEILNDYLDENQKITDEVILELKPLAFYTFTMSESFRNSTTEK